MHSSYELGGRLGVSVLEFQIDEPGPYKMECIYPDGKVGSDAIFAVSDNLIQTIFKMVVQTFVIGLSGFGMAVGVCVWTYEKRRKAEKPHDSRPQDP